MSVNTETEFSFGEKKEEKKKDPIKKRASEKLSELGYFSTDMNEWLWEYITLNGDLPSDDQIIAAFQVFDIHEKKQNRIVRDREDFCRVVCATALTTFVFVSSIVSWLR